MPGEKVSNRRLPGFNAIGFYKTRSRPVRRLLIFYVLFLRYFTVLEESKHWLDNYAQSLQGRYPCNPDPPTAWELRGAQSAAPRGNTAAGTALYFVLTVETEMKEFKLTLPFEGGCGKII